MNTKEKAPASPEARGGRAVLTEEVIKEIQRVNNRRVIVGQNPVYQPLIVETELMPSNQTFSEEAIFKVLGVKRPNNTPAGEMWATVVTISPGQAYELMKFNSHNRNVSHPYMSDIARQMQEGAWTANGDSLRFCEDGTMLDGQHRLLGCYASGQPFTTVVVFGLKRITQLTMDSGRKRSSGDQLRLLGEQYGTAIAATARWVFAIATDSINFRISTPEIAVFLNKYPMLRESAARVHRSRPKGPSIPQLAALHFLAVETLDQKDRADRFVRVFGSGIPDYPNDPAHRLRERLIDARAHGRAVTSTIAMNHMIVAWNAFRKKQTFMRGMFRDYSKLSGNFEREQIEGFNPSSIDIQLPKQVVSKSATLPLLRYITE